MSHSSLGNYSSGIRVAPVAGEPTRENFQQGAQQGAVPSYGSSHGPGHDLNPCLGRHQLGGARHHEQRYATLRQVREGQR